MDSQASTTKKEEATTPAEGSKVDRTKVASEPKLDSTKTRLPPAQPAEEMQEDRSNVQFPWRLHELLSEAEEKGFGSVISWLPNQNAFKVLNKIKFTNEVLPAYFNATKYKRFQRVGDE